MDTSFTVHHKVPGGVLIVDDQLNLGLVADELHGVPLEVVELDVEGRGHLTLASPEIDMNLKPGNVNNVIRGGKNQHLHHSIF